MCLGSAAALVFLEDTGELIPHAGKTVMHFKVVIAEVSFLLHV